MKEIAGVDRRQVPTIRDVIPGALVNIVLKQDQPTGRTVSGTVQNVLTRGNHPRGIKVRLADGRVGRVQTMATGTENSAVPTQQGSDGRRPRPDQYDRDLPPLPQIGLDAYLKPAKHQRAPPSRAGAGASSSTTATASPRSDTMVQGWQDYGAAENEAPAIDETATCPVCGDFTGDEAAVAHHVASHFDE
ncbi:hypothetical protein B0T22DRAFT_499861 [Podospora appendiculata]|uniref:UBZ4-type domain-containing protein n=1 Tax=Podospora appendiculata TaxID=314037 RepID=A0AAE1CEE4_9PEZI|nr:hypothetical protein B0T22DRAFT_499861 [Podospora appendiculata]